MGTLQNQYSFKIKTENIKIKSYIQNINKYYNSI